MASTKLVWNYAKLKAMEEITGVTPATTKSIKSVVENSQPDLYQLPPLSDNVLREFELLERQEEEDIADKTELYQGYCEDVDQLDFDSEHFKSLPAEIQHELITEKRVFEKNRSSVQPETLPENASDFSSYQLTRLVQRSQLSKRLDDVRKSLTLAESSAVVGLDPNSCQVEVNRIASDETARYILIKSQGGGGGVDNVGSDVISSDNVSENETEGNRELDTNDDKSLDTTSHDAVDITNDKIALNDSSNEGSTDNAADITGDKGGDRACDILIDEKVGNTIASKGGNRNTDKFNSQHDTNVDILDMGDNKADTNVTKVDTDGDTTSDKDDSISAKVNAIGDDKIDLTCDISSTTTSDRPDTNITTNMISDTVDLDSDNKEAVVTKVSTKVDKSGDTNDGGVVCIETPEEPVISLTSTTSLTSTAGLTSSSIATTSQPITQSQNTVPYSNTTQDTSPSHQPHLTSEVEIMSDGTDTDSEPEDLAPSAKKVCLENDKVSNSGNDLLQSVQQELATTSARDLQKEWEQERLQLQSEQARQSRLAATVSNEIYDEAKELLSLFGVPYIISPCEAEAQCAQLDMTCQVSGTITDDSDYFLFGGKQAFRSFFSASRDIACYQDDKIQHTLGLDRLQLINLAYLLGSDYTVGVAGVGVVTAMEVLRDFPGCGLEVLQKFKTWHDHSTPNLTDKSKLRSLKLEPSFPDERVQDAYLHPLTDDSQEQFEWGTPDLDLLRQYAREKFAWDKKKTDQELIPVIRSLNQRRERQAKITDFVPPQLGPAGLPIRSRRLRDAVLKIKQHQEQSGCCPEPAPPARKELALSESSDED
ncbi:DNA excision repair protein ERCC-5 homolog isoform X2 [Dysidea avara]